MRHIVQVLHADDFADAPAHFDLLRGDVAEADVTHKALPLKVGQNIERRLDRPFSGSVDRAHDPQIDDFQHVEPEIAQIVLDRALEVIRAHGRIP